jgi:transcriptional regulator with XRE-family HTH domain
VNNLSAIHYPAPGFPGVRLRQPETPYPEPWGARTCTSTGVYPDLDPDGLVSTILLFGFGFTNATAAAETAKSLRLKAQSLGQLTSASGEDILARIAWGTIATGIYANGDDAQRISDIRLHTGLTWEQVARLFGVSRRTVHLWASGSAMSSEHEEHLHRVFSAIESSGLFEVHGSRAAILFTAGSGGSCPFDMLVSGRYEEAARELRLRAPPVHGPQRRVPDASVFQERRPLSPAVLMSGLPDSGPPEPRRTARPQVRRVKRDP